MSFNPTGGSYMFSKRGGFCDLGEQRSIFCILLIVECSMIVTTNSCRVSCDFQILGIYCLIEYMYIIFRARMD